MMLKKYRPSLSKIFLIIIVIYMLLSYRGTIRGMVIVPIAYVIFIFRLFSSSIDQEVLWISFVLISSLIALISLGMRWEPAPKETPTEDKYHTRLKTWQTSVKSNQRSDYFKWSLARDMSNLVIKAIAYREGASRSQVLRRLSSDNLELPPDIAEYLQIAQKPFTQHGFSNRANGNWFTRTWEKLAQTPTSGGNNVTTPLDLEPDKIIRYLEDYLELDPEIWQV